MRKQAEILKKQNLIPIEIYPNGKNPYRTNWTDTTLENCMKYIKDTDNLAILMGPVSMVTGVDFDDMIQYNNLIYKYGPIIAPYEITPNGIHYFFKYDKYFITSTKCFKLDGIILDIDIKNDGGCMNTYPSIINGNKYEGIIYQKNFKEFPPIPEWLKKLYFKTGNDYLTSNTYSKYYMDNLVNCQHKFYGDIMGKEFKNEIVIINNHGDGYVYDYNKALWILTSKNNISWLITEKAEIKLKEIGNILLNKFSSKNTEDENIYKKIPKAMLKVGSSNFVKSVFDAMSRHLLDEDFENKLNNIKYLVPIKNNQTINLKTLKIEPRFKKDYFSFEIDCEFLKDDNLKHSSRFFKELMCDNIDNYLFLQKCLGYCITGEIRERCFFVFWGQGANGKSTLTELMKKILKNFYQSASPKIFIKSNSSAGASPHLMALKDSRVCVLSELEQGMQLNQSTLKAITGGDSISCRQLYCKQTTINPICKPILLCNLKPQFDCNDQAMIDRLKYIPFNARFIKNPDPNEKNEYKRDCNFIEELQTTYINEVFTWLCIGANNWYNDINLIPTKNIIEATNEYLNDIDIVAKFLDEYCEITKSNKDFISVSILKTIFKDSFCKENDCTMKLIEFNRIMTKCKNYVVKKRNGKRSYIGLKFNDEENEKDELDFM